MKLEAKSRKWIESYGLDYKNLLSIYGSDFYSILEEHKSNFDYNFDDTTYTSILDKLSKGVPFSDDDNDLLTQFVNGISSKISDIDQWLHLIHKEMTLPLYKYFNNIQKCSTYQQFRASVENDVANMSKVNGHFRILFSICKFFNDPDQYPIYIKIWKNIAHHVFDVKKDDYDEFCKFYRNQMKEVDSNKIYYFDAYISVIATLLSRNIDAYTVSESDYLKIKDNILTIDYYKQLADENYNMKRDEVEVAEPEVEYKTSKAHVQFPLNQILYGPPGTGKTYHTIEMAVKICEPTFTFASRKELKNKYDELVKNGRIVFTTFHQSMSYEDFVEGIKPMDPSLNDGQVAYDIQDGLFKQVCKEARKIQSKHTNIDWNNADYYKMSLGGRNRPDIHEYCIENNVIALGWGGNKSLESFSKLDQWEDFKNEYKNQFLDFVKESPYNITAAFTFLKMKTNDIVVISKGNRSIDAIGVIKGDYFFDDTLPVEFNHFRKVEWIATDLDTSPERFFTKKISQQTIYQLYNNNVKYQEFTELTSSNRDSNRKPYVIIIDEINRGNVSEIFGELITLLEEDKRKGMENEIVTKLPYSKSEFSVPSNIYIIGTMNTADRSIEALDTALRRRFCFKEIRPQSDILEKHGVSVIGSINVAKILDIINQRIEMLLDRDHQIGHSYFLNVKNIDDFKSCFKNCIIPLLQEYFYNDYSKIGLILGKGFIKRKHAVTFADFDDDTYLDSDVKLFDIIDDFTDNEFISATNLLLNRKDTDYLNEGVEA